MSRRIIDITDKLGFAERPAIRVRGSVLEVDNTAVTLLRVMQIVGDGNGLGVDEINAVYELLFDAKARKAIDRMQLDVEDFTTLVMEAIGAATGQAEEDDEGNAATPATT